MLSIHQHSHTTPITLQPSIHAYLKALYPVPPITISRTKPLRLRGCVWSLCYNLCTCNCPILPLSIPQIRSLFPCWSIALTTIAEAVGRCVVVVTGVLLPGLSTQIQPHSLCLLSFLFLSTFHSRVCHFISSLSFLDHSLRYFTIAHSVLVFSLTISQS